MIQNLPSLSDFKVEVTCPVKHYFKCTRCGLCCKGSVELTPREYEIIVKLAEKLNVRVPIEVKDYITHVKIVLKPVEDSEGEKWCVFLKREDNIATCIIYEHRPVFCRLFPLYIGISEALKTIYVDVIHCPEVRHERQDDYSELDVQYCRENTLQCISYNSELLESIPNLDKEVIVFDLGDTVAVAKLHLKYQLTKLISELMIRDISEKTTWLELLQRTLALQYAIRDIVSSFIGRKKPEDIAELARRLVLESISRANEEHVSEQEVFYLVNLALSDLGLKIDQDRVAVHDAKRMSIRVAKLDLSTLRLEVGDLLVYLREVIARLPTFFQIHHLPMEVVYSHGYFLIFAVASVYSSVLQDLDRDSKIASIDMGALPYVFKYVTALARSLYASQTGKNYVEVESLI